ncbi:hypothetical protein [Hydrogenimonas cancrithermarum]|uniref:LTXXQ motif family protein n=1 Tax=Hydrogenimonas cancrithermarum TaxID=2993563 RepID=A0ABM8FJW0_9BACT|nr:hypothetical protein [Hydrogenimonas cancrithermarum]BDY12598.1 hypothetical protein HCR_09100 [Hydrogenimonas cancrithermarum]
MNKISKITAALLLGASMSLFAADTATDNTATATTDTEVQTQTDTSVQSDVPAESTESASADTEASTQTDVDAQIERIQNANPEERRELMNQFKEQLATMNQEERMEAISLLREKMTTNQNEAMAHTGEGMATMEAKMKGMAQTQQAMQMQHTGAMEQMNQKQALDQFMHGQAGGSVGGNIGGNGGAQQPPVSMPFQQR